jgi:hypothetical protein
MVRGVPVFAAREFAGPFLNWPVAKQVGRTLTNPVVALILMGITMFAWHVPAAYEMALRSSAWHQVEHACFLLTSLIFWWPVVQPWPTRERWPRWAMVPYLLIADLQNTVLSAILIFSDRVLYPSYAAAPRLFGFSALQDQAAAGAMMWVLGSVAFVIPAVVIAIQCLSPKRSPREFTGAAAQPHSSSLPWDSSPFDVLPQDLKGRLTPRARQAVWFVILFVATGLLFARLSAGSSDDDDQGLRFSGESGPFIVSVFSQPGNLPQGPVEFNILTQDRSTGEVLLDATAVLSAKSVAGETTDGPTAQAGYDASENKLFQTAEMSFAVPGDWNVTVVLARNGQVAEFSMPLHIVKAETRPAVPWSYVMFLIVAVGLMAIYVRRHRIRKGRVGVT